MGVGMPGATENSPVRVVELEIKVLLTSLVRDYWSLDAVRGMPRDASSIGRSAGLL
jgi:hypothetical protein